MMHELLVHQRTGRCSNINKRLKRSQTVIQVLLSMESDTLLSNICQNRFHRFTSLTQAGVAAPQGGLAEETEEWRQTLLIKPHSLTDLTQR